MKKLPRWEMQRRSSRQKCSIDCKCTSPAASRGRQLLQMRALYGPRGRRRRARPLKLNGSDSSLPPFPMTGTLEVEGQFCLVCVQLWFRLQVGSRLQLPKINMRKIDGRLACRQSSFTQICKTAEAIGRKYS